MKKLTFAGAALAALTASSALAQPPAPPAGGPPPLRRADVEQQLREQFQRLDANHDGILTREEAAADQGQRGPAAPGAGGERRPSGDELFDRLDTNHDGMLSREEFAGLRAMFRGGGGGGWGGRGGGGGMFNLNGNWFDRVDANHDGKVTLDEMRTTLLGLFDRVDANHDGTITPEEREAFVRAMRARQQPQGPGPAPDGQ
ncbi:MAG TPA: EF-hand domain-containing protein [Allosphingosinicella sp.]|nr:EF-hand domain-containing protein [Allosphingosinicella sp.]